MSLAESIMQKFRPPVDDNTPAKLPPSDEKVAKKNKAKGTEAKHIDECRNAAQDYVGMEKKQPVQKGQGGVLHIRSNILDTELLIVPDGFLDDTKVWTVQSLSSHVI